MATTGTGGAGAPRDIGSVSVGPNAPTYLGADGQQHQYIGQSASGVWQYDSAYPPATGSSTPGNGSVSAGSGPGLVESFQPFIGKLELGTAILATLAAAVLVGLEVVTVGTAVFWLAGLLALDAAVGVLSSAAIWFEHKFGGDPNEPGIDPITKAIRTAAKVLGMGGLMGDFILTGTICGAMYYFSHRQGVTRIQVFRPAKVRANPPRRRAMRRVGPARKLLK
jgi:hypothetical protein